MLFCFLPITLAAVRLSPKKLKNTVLLLFSLLFYLIGERKFFLLLPVTALVSYLFGLALSSEKTGKRAKRFLLYLSVALGLLPLLFFKYADFFISLINGFTGASLPSLSPGLPVGISFFTFQSISYNIDIYRGQAAAEKNFVSYAAYLCLFPQLIAGPIVRYSEISDRLRDRHVGITDFSDGVVRFVIGLSKKVLLANSLGQISADYAASGGKTVAFAWLSAISYTLQIYFDFSGYSDMAIGLGRMLGFRFPENFNYPYTARSITSFWRRWHITLSGWFRDYVYIPLGGNRVGKSRMAINLLVVWTLTGLWHGAGVNFLMWGLLYGILLVAEKLIFGNFFERHPAVGHLYTLFFVVTGFVIFGADNAHKAFSGISALFGIGGLPLINGETLFYLAGNAVLLAVGIAASTPLPKKLFCLLPEKAKNLLIPILTAAGLLLSTAYLVDGSFNPFLYFRF